MDDSAGSRAHGYDSLYEAFDSALMRQLRAESYAEDIGQHSWVTADELRGDITRLRLSPGSRFLDLGCGPGGPLTFVLRCVGCHGTGIELSAPALSRAEARAAELGVAHLATLHPADLSERIPFPERTFDAAMSLDVVLHLRDREAFYREVARTLVPGGRLLITDAGVLTGAMSSEEARLRSVHGFTQFTAPGFNQRMLEQSGFRLLEVEDRTLSTLQVATGRLSAMMAHREELVRAGGSSEFELQRGYLETVIELSRRGAVSRRMYLAEVTGA